VISSGLYGCLPPLSQGKGRLCINSTWFDLAALTLFDVLAVINSGAILVPSYVPKSLSWLAFRNRQYQPDSTLTSIG
jgi:hypothetical protein